MQEQVSLFSTVYNTLERVGEKTAQELASQTNISLKNVLGVLRVGVLRGQVMRHTIKMDCLGHKTIKYSIVTDEQLREWRFRVLSTLMKHEAKFTELCDEVQLSQLRMYDVLTHMTVTEGVIARVTGRGEFIRDSFRMKHFVML